VNYEKKQKGVSFMKHRVYAVAAAAMYSYLSANAHLCLRRPPTAIRDDTGQQMSKCRDAASKPVVAHPKSSVSRGQIESIVVKQGRKFRRADGRISLSLARK